MRTSKQGDTVGITLRLPKKVLDRYQDIAARANLLDLKRGGKGLVTAQDVMRHRLASIPGVKRQGNDNKPLGGKDES
jgi:hypothetical protein